MKRFTWGIVFIASLLLSSCGGGGGGVPLPVYSASLVALIQSIQDTLPNTCWNFVQGSNPQAAGIEGKKLDGTNLIFLVVTNSFKVGTTYVGVIAVYTASSGAQVNDTVNLSVLAINGATITFTWTGGSKIISAGGFDGYTAYQSNTCGD